MCLTPSPFVSFLFHQPQAILCIPTPCIAFYIKFSVLLSTFYCGTPHFSLKPSFFFLDSGHGTVSFFSLTFQKFGSPDFEYSLWPSLPGNWENVWVLHRCMESKASRVVPGNMVISVLERLEMTLSCSPFSDS